uniref:SGF29 C-terminal domain-containing protein n=1 Tax=Strigamia maritima TaxID=126957 RepID=T1J5N8_STRMM
MGRVNVSNRPSSSQSTSGSSSSSAISNALASLSASTSSASSNSQQGDTLVTAEKLKELNRLIHQCHEEKNRSEHNLTNIAKTHERMQQEKKLSPYYKTKLKGLYNTAMQDAESEAELLRKALDNITDMRAARIEKRIQAKHYGSSIYIILAEQNALTIPLWTGKVDEKPPPLCGAIPCDSNYIAKVKDMVAALVKGIDGDENWILAEVVSYNHSTNKYEVDDIDEDQKERHTVSRRRIVILPLMRADPETDSDALYEVGTLVLALYPQTTCFYRGVVHDRPKGPQDDYLVLFEDISYAEGYSPPLVVAQRYIMPWKEIKKK